MKLLRFGPQGEEKPGLLDDDGTIRDLSGLIDDLGPTTLDAATLARIASQDAVALPAVDGLVRLGPPVAAVGKFICVGLNYSDHAREAGLEVPSEPVLFAKATSCICGPDDPVEKPADSTKLDWEVELAVVIGTPGRNIAEEKALDHAAGYTIVNDISERTFQIERQGQWIKGKSHDTFGPVGPWLVTRDEIDDPQNLDLWLDVNGDARQRGNTRTMVFPVAHCIAYVSRFMSLQVGDILSTGTPPGVGLGMKPPTFLEIGDTITLGVTGLGTQHQTVVAATDP
ncbi:MAG: fumarylacetoacetate hydrolase family protein [Pseudomonadota bacterium]